MKRFAILCLLMMTSVAVAKTNSSASSAVFNSVYAARDASLNTNPQSAFWSKAESVDLAFDNWGKPLVHDRSQVRSRWTKKNLYFLFICPYQTLNLKPNPHPETETNQLWKWDVAEVFIGSDFQHIRHYKEFEVSPQAEWVDLDINLDAPHEEGGWLWNSGFQVSARIDRQKKIWYGAMRIPFSAIDPTPPHAGAVLRVNMFRMQGPAPNTKLIVWQPTMSKTFHVPEHFGTLKLVDHP